MHFFSRSHPAVAG